MSGTNNMIASPIVAATLQSLGKQAKMYFTILFLQWIESRFEVGWWFGAPRKATALMTKRDFSQGYGNVILNVFIDRRMMIHSIGDYCYS